MFPKKLLLLTIVILLFSCKPVVRTYNPRIFGQVGYRLNPDLVKEYGKSHFREEINKLEERDILKLVEKDINGIDADFILNNTFSLRNTNKNTVSSNKYYSSFDNDYSDSILYSFKGYSIQTELYKVKQLDQNADMKIYEVKYKFDILVEFKSKSKGTVNINDLSFAGPESGHVIYPSTTQIEIRKENDEYKYYLNDDLIPSDYHKLLDYIINPDNDTNVGSNNDRPRFLGETWDIDIDYDLDELSEFGVTKEMVHGNTQLTGLDNTSHNLVYTYSYAIKDYDFKRNMKYFNSKATFFEKNQYVNPVDNTNPISYKTLNFGVFEKLNGKNKSQYKDVDALYCHLLQFDIEIEKINK